MKSKRGGKRANAGNKAKDGANASNSIRVCVVIFKRQMESLKKLGGSFWIRSRIDEESNAKVSRGAEVPEESAAGPTSDRPAG